MDNMHFKLRTTILAVVTLIFAWAIYPLTPQDFYETFRKTLNAANRQAGEELIVEARELQTNSPDKNPAVALLEVADARQVKLNRLVEGAKGGDNSDVVAMIRKKASGSIRLGLDLNGGVEFVLDLVPDADFLAQFEHDGDKSDRAELEKRIEREFNHYRDQAIETLRKRLETQNIFESEISPFGSRSISLKAPIVSKDEKDKLQSIIQMSCKLRFRLVHPDNDRLVEEYRRDPANFMPPPGYMLLSSTEKIPDADTEVVNYYFVSRRAEMDGRDIVAAAAEKDSYGQLRISLSFNAAGAEQFGRITSENINRQLAIVLDGKLYCAPYIRAAIVDGNASISGSFSHEEAQNIADALTAGSFPFQIKINAVYDTAPSLGADNVRNGIWAGLLALALLTVFMCVYYRRAGVIAVLALALNVVLIMGAMAAFGATLTMPGIAGIILTLGMAVDANVLIFERIREELNRGRNLAAAIPLGYEKAFSAVLDGNVTTLLIGVILMYFGSGPVKGFAVSLSIGIASSMFTALFMTRLIFDYALRFRQWKTLKMCRFFSKPNYNFIKARRWAFPLSGTLLVLSVIVCLVKGSSMLGVDFTGGTMLSFNYAEEVPVKQLETSLQAANLEARIGYKANASMSDNRKVEFLIREIDLSGDQQATDIKSRVLEKLSRDFPQLQLSDGQESTVGGLVGWEMSKSALLSIVLAVVGMIIYVSLRFEFSYAIAGMIALAHDVLIALGIFLLMGRELSLPVVAALLTIIGYSINDTIVIFDRIREEVKLIPDKTYSEIINISINQTLSRTILTSVTTLLVVVVMFCFGGIAINDFVLVMMLGIVIGTFSSIFIASPIVSFWHRKIGMRVAREK